MKLWKDMSETEHNVMKAAHEAGHGIEYLSQFFGKWTPVAGVCGWYNDDAYRIAPSAQADTPTLWRDMSDAEKGALLLAAFNGTPIDVMVNGDWVSCDKVWPAVLFDNVAYRVKPKAPKVETHILDVFVLDGELFARGSEDTGPRMVTHTYTITDGRVTACDTVIHGEEE